MAHFILCDIVLIVVLFVGNNSQLNLTATNSTAVVLSKITIAH